MYHRAGYFFDYMIQSSTINLCTAWLGNCEWSDVHGDNN